MKAPSRRLAGLLCAALLGVAFAGGLVAAALAGTSGALLYATAAALLLAVAVQRGRRLLTPPARPAGRTCTCCTATQHDPVRVV